MTRVAEPRRSPAVWIGTAGGVGFVPFASGTLGSAVGLGVVAALGAIPVAPAYGTALLAVSAALLFIAGVWSAGETEKFLSRKDPSPVVIDEVVGQMITFLLWPHAAWKTLLAGFVLFRVLDIAKPFPAGRAERLAAGWGIMVDDVVAGIYALIALALLGHWVR